MSDSDFTELAQLAFERKDYQATANKFQHVYVKRVMPMPEYRSYKAGVLIQLREQRNARRACLRRQFDVHVKAPVEHDIQQVDALLESLLVRTNKQIQYYTNSSDKSYGEAAIKAYGRYLSYLLSTHSEFQKLLSPSTRALAKCDLQAKHLIDDARTALYQRLVTHEMWAQFDIQWAAFKSPVISLSKKPIDFDTNVLW